MDIKDSNNTFDSSEQSNISNEREKDYILELSDPPIYFEHISGLTNVFYEKDNQQIFCVRSNGVGGVIVKGPKQEHNLTFRIMDKGNVTSIKFSPNFQIIGIIRQEKSVEFINFKNGQPEIGEYSQQFRIQQNTSSTLKYDFYWINNTELLFVCNQSFEHYQIYPERRQLKLLKTFQISTNWIIWSREMQLFVASTSHFGTIINPFVYYKSQFQKLPKFEVDLPLPPHRLHLYYTQLTNTHTRLNESDVVIGCVYNEYYVMVIRQLLPPHSPALPPPALTTSSNSNNKVAAAYSEIVMYKLNTENPAKKTHILRIQLNGRFVLSIVDDLLIVHHQLTHSSLLYDIKINGYNDGYVTYHKPIIKNAQIKSYEIPASHLTLIGLIDKSSNTPTLSAASSSSSTGSTISNTLTKNASFQMDIYSKNWIMFLPNVIIDTKLCCFWFLRLRFNNINTINELYDWNASTEDSGDDRKFILIEFLLNRKNTKKLLLNICFDMLYKRSKLKDIEVLFDKINAFYRFVRTLFLQQINNTSTNTVNNQQQSQTNSIFTINQQSSNIQSLTASQLPVIEQFDMYNEILHPLFEDENWWNFNMKYSLAILIEYFRSLNDNQIPIEHYLYKLLINALIKSNRLYQLHQYLQYHVLNDSKPLACFLLSLQKRYPASMQLALDMLKRLGTATEEIIEILLTKGYIISAIRYANANGHSDKLLTNSKRFLDYAKDLNDKFIYHAVYKYFEEKNVKLINETPMPDMQNDSLHDVYTLHFNELFQLS